jgi:hypothetical protein
MKRYISFGKYNKLYKYIWIVVSIRLIIDYLYTDNFPEQMRPNFLSAQNFPSSFIIEDLFIYITTMILAIFIYIYESRQYKKIREDDNNELSSSQSSIKLIHNQMLPGNINMKTVIFICLLSIVSIETIFVIMFHSLDTMVYWSLDLFFIGYINLIVFGIPLYSHKKFAIIFILIFSGLFQLLSSYEVLFNEDFDSFFKFHIIFIPIITISYMLLSIARYYSLSRIKWLLDFRGISLSIFLIGYSALGVFITIIVGLITSYNKCPDKSQFKGINYICSVEIKKDNYIEYYYDNFSYFFEKLWKKEESIGVNFVYFFLYIIKLFLNSLRLLYSFLLIKNLNTEYYQCSFEIYFIILNIFGLIKVILNGENIKLQIYILLGQIAALIGLMIYLELIEIKVHNLDKNVKRYIEMRSMNEFNSLNELNEEKDI